MASALPDPDGAIERAEAYARDEGRLAVVAQTGLLDAGIQESLQRYVRLAAELTGAPVSLLSIIDADRQYFAAAHGLELEETPLEASYCKHVAAENLQLAVEDSTQDDVFATSPGTTELGVRAYLGSPVEAGGMQIGSFCSLDYEPRDWDDRQRQVIADLAAALSAEVQLRVTLTERSRQAVTDAMTGLPNRRALNAALEEAVAAGRPVRLALFDLDGFKAYNDRFGHPAGDHLLVRLATKLSAAVEGRGEPFRMGGDEFCVLTEDQAVVDAALAALSERGPGFAVGVSVGVAELPAEASDAATALGLADRRLYAAKRGRPGSIDDQVSAVLSMAVTERDGALAGHSEEVADIAGHVARQLGMDDEEVRLVERAARLHDVGKVAIPDAILLKPGPLDEREWELMRRHTLIGERIVGAAPALGAVGRLVRASHERWDGGGYPDGLAGEDIPLGARVIFACDAFHAMISDRPYGVRRTPAEAIEELGRCAGTQFDPRVVAAVEAACADLVPVT